MKRYRIHRLARVHFLGAAVAPLILIGSLAISTGIFVRPAAAFTGNGVANLALANLGENYCSTNSLGGTGFENSCSAQEWCADFAKWVWANEGAGDPGTLTAAAGSFYVYGQDYETLSDTPAVGDAVVFNYGYEGAGTAQHVAIVVAVNGSQVTSVGGDEGSGSTTQTTVEEDTYNGAIGYSSYWGMDISGYVAPVGESSAP
ncbi:MAG TPA: CHAP domain-containing protein, partial [Acidimicrobiales bacterium]|nr:CHAP domain-containing protein [Acidimicrobiales bacterium]